MPRYNIDIRSDVGAIESEDREGVALEHVGLAEAFAVDALVGASRDRPPPSQRRTTTVTVWDKHGVVYRDSVTCAGPSPDDVVVGRAIRAMREAKT